MSFYICKCGFSKKNHPFKHEFEKNSKVLKRIIGGKDHFTVDSNNYEELKGVKCSHKDCKLNLELHKTLYSKEFIEENKGIVHKFEPFEFSYKKIVFALPFGTKCHICNIEIEEHKFEDPSGLTLTDMHEFNTRVEFLNSNKMDKITVVDPNEEGIEIKYKKDEME